MKLKPPRDKQKLNFTFDSNPQKKTRIIVQNLILGAIAFLLAISLSYLFWQPGDKELNLSSVGRNWFTKSTLLTNVYALFDLGVVDLNADNILDIFTANHSDRQFLILGEGQGEFSENVLSQIGLDQQPEFPGLEPVPAKTPAIKKSGIYIYWQGRQIVIANHQTENFDAFKGDIQLSANIATLEENSFAVEVQEEKLNEQATASLVQFAAQNTDGRLVLNPFNQSIRITFKLNENIPLEQIFIGDRKINPTDHEFSFQLRDRHGIAWTDLDGSGFLDAFVSRGGLRGRMPNLPETYRDELLVSHENSTYKYQDIASQSNLTKNGCAGHQTAWVDYDGDGNLDIYNVCAIPPEASQPAYPNQLFRQDAEGKFLDVAAEANLDIPVGGHFVWLDADRDGDMDLLWSEAEKFQLYTNQLGKFEPQTIRLNSNKAFKFGESKKLTVADFDNDGDFDVFSVSPKGNVLLENVDNKYQLLDPQSIGLPATGLTANWVDYDNDGVSDLHVVPGGIYRQNQDGTFIATNLLQSDRPEYLQHSLANWFDADNNGTRDLLIQTEYKLSLYKQIRDKFINRFFPQQIKSHSSTIDLYSNTGTDNHWLELKLVGLPGNRSAIGTQVEVITPIKTQLQAVGQSEGSDYSQGHYRLYFGLGKEPINAIKILWSDGYLQEIDNVASDRLLTVKRTE